MEKVRVVVGAIVVVGVGIFLLMSPQSKKPNTVTTEVTKTPVNEQKEIQTVLESYVPRHGGVSKFEIIEIKTKDNFARTTLKPIDVETDNATVFLEKKNGKWEVIAGPGTGFDPNDPSLKHLPKELLP